jgi:hypothetical protein
MIKVSIEPPKERIVTIQMTEGEARTLSTLSANISYTVIQDFGGCHKIAVDGSKLFKNIRKVLREGNL